MSSEITTGSGDKLPVQDTSGNVSSITQSILADEETIRGGSVNTSKQLIELFTSKSYSSSELSIPTDSPSYNPEEGEEEEDKWAGDKLARTSSEYLLGTSRSEMVIQELIYNRPEEDDEISGRYRADSQVSEVWQPEEIEWQNGRESEGRTEMEKTETTSVLPEESIRDESWTEESEIIYSEVYGGKSIETLVSEAERPDSDAPKMREFIFETISKETLRMYFRTDATIIEAKRRIGTVFKAHPEKFKLSFHGKECEDDVPLSDFEESPPTTTTKFYIYSFDQRQYFSPGQFDRYTDREKEVVVKIPQLPGVFKEVRVKIVDQSYFTEWHGGYRNRKTDVEYHNKAVQTLPRRRAADKPAIYTRQTQTPAFPMKEAAVDTARDKATQMWRADHHIPNKDDRIIVANPYLFRSSTGRTKFSNVVKIVVLIQKLCRNMRARTEKRRRESFTAECLNNERKAREAILQALKMANRREIIGTALPKDRGDFYMLYLLVGKWWRREIGRIERTKRNEAKTAASFNLLEKEIQHLLVIEKKRADAKKEIFAKREISFLETTARPIIFRDNKGVISSIDNVGTQQAKELQELLSSFLRLTVTVVERIDILQNLKLLLTKYGCYHYYREIYELIDRECDLLIMGMNDDNLKGLRQRTLDLLQFFLHDYIVNPRAERYSRQTESKCLKTTFRCMYCGKLKMAHEYNVHVRMTRFSMCHSCEWINNIACKRTNVTPYSRILQQVRDTETKYCCHSSNCFVLQPIGMSYLVQKIWDDKSVISDCNRLDELRMIRFKKEEDWSPWNCILLTLEECVAHNQVSDIERFYDEWLLKKIYNKHLRAKLTFLPLIVNDREICESGLWTNVSDAGKFLHPANVANFAIVKDFNFLQN